MENGGILIVNKSFFQNRKKVSLEKPKVFSKNRKKVSCKNARTVKARLTVKSIKPSPQNERDNYKSVKKKVKIPVEATGSESYE